MGSPVELGCTDLTLRVCQRSAGFFVERIGPGDSYPASPGRRSKLATKIEEESFAWAVPATSA